MHTLQRRRNLILHDPVCQPFHNRRLTYAGLTRQDRIVLPPPHEDIDHLPNLGVTPQHRIDLSRLRICRHVHGELVKVRRLSFTRCGSIIRRRIACAAACLQRSLHLARVRHDRVEILSQPLRLYPHQLLADVFGQPRQLIVGQQRQHREARAHAARVVLDRRDRPRLGQHLYQAWTERR